ncbi:hypothetical protein D9M69_566470 [compost metagenome]
MAIRQLSNASIPNFSTAFRNVAWGQTRMLSSLLRKTPTDSAFPPSDPGALHRFHFGSTSQSAQKPNVDSGSFAKLEPIDFSGTVMIAFRTP